MPLRVKRNFGSCDLLITSEKNERVIIEIKYLIEKDIKKRL
jgi:hypothetical protein